MVHRSLLVLVVFLSLALSRCSGGSSSSPTAPTATTPAPTTSTTTPTAPPAAQPPSTTFSGWAWDGRSWYSLGTAPSCASSLVLPLPVDMSRVTSILYPGQVRGDYKAHGGFRFDQPGQTTSVNVVAPIAGTLLRASRYLASCEIQYTFDFVNDCGIMFRFGHLRDLAARFQAVADTLPAPIELDSRSTPVSGVTVAAGEIVGTGVGLRDSARNVFVDYGVYDLRQRNRSSQDPTWLAAHDNDTHAYAVCWFDLLSPADAALVRSLPSADFQMGKTSDYCK